MMMGGWLRKALSCLMAVVLTVGLCPGAALAQGSGGPLGTGSSSLLAQDGDIASGTWGSSCPWRISSDGTLTIGPGEVVLNDDDDDFSIPWNNYRSSITSVKSGGRVVLPEDCVGLFEYCENLVSADLSGFDTSNVTNMNWMFAWSPLLASVNISSFDTSKVQYMGDMFAGCSSLTSVDLSHFDTRNVESISRMFVYCTSLSELDLSSFDTSKVADTEGAFHGCYGLKKLVVGDSFSFKDNSTGEEVLLPGVSWLSNATGAWYTPEQIASTRSNIADTYTRPAGQDVAQGTWGSCSWKVSSDFVLTIGEGVGTDIEQDFYFSGAPWGAYSSDISSVQTTGTVTLPAKCPGLFAGCGMKRFDGTGFDTSNVEDMSSMFRNCNNLESVDLSGFNTSKVKSMDSMFFCPLGGNDVLKTLDLSSFDTSNVEEMSWMFCACGALQTIYVGDGWSTRKVSGPTTMFHCPSLVGGNGTRFDSEHMDVSYARIDNPGSPGYFTRKGQAPFTADIAEAQIAPIPDQVWAGSAVEPAVVVTYGGNELIAGTHYRATYTDNTGIGTATVTIEGMGSFTGSAYATFKIVARGSSESQPETRVDDGTHEAHAREISGGGDGGSYDSNKDGDTGQDNATQIPSGNLSSGGAEGQPAVSVGESVASGGATYKVTSAGSSASVAFAKAPKSKKSVKVPATVKVDGKAYKVTSVAAGAFKGAKATKVTLGKNVKKVAKGAFKGSKVKTVAVKSKKLTKKSVKGCFKGSKVKTVKVPKSKLKAYKKIFTKANCGKKVEVVAA